MTTHYEDGITFSDADITGATGPVNFIDKLAREHDIESLDVDLKASITTANAATEIGVYWQGWELRLAYDDIEFVIPMAQLAAYQYFWYKDEEPAVVSANCYTLMSEPTTYMTRGHFRLKVNCPAASGKFLQVQIRKITGTAAWCATAPNVSGNGTYTFNPIYGSFDKSIACQYVAQYQFATQQNLYPASVGDVLAGVILSCIKNVNVFAADGVCTTNSLGANYNANAVYTHIKLEAGDQTLLDSWFNPQKFQVGELVRVQDGVGQLGADIALQDYIITTDVACKGATIKGTVKPSATSDTLMLVIYTKGGSTVKTTVTDVSQPAASGGASHTAGPKTGGLQAGGVSGPSARNLRA